MTDEEIQSHQYTLEEISQHNKLDDCWCIYKNKVYDCTLYNKRFHPGGSGCFQKFAGKDITQACKIHSFIPIEQYMRDICIGIVLNKQQNDEIQNAFEQQTQFQEDVITTIHGQIL